MRALTSSNDYRYYPDVGQIEHRRECDQPTLPAEEIEGQVVEWLQGVSQCLPEDWEERVAEAVIPAEEREDLERRERELKARIERATRLHLEGHISYERFAEEKHRAQAGLADLRRREWRPQSQPKKQLRTSPIAEKRWTELNRMGSCEEPSQKPRWKAQS